MAVPLWDLIFGSTADGFVVPSLVDLRAAAVNKIREYRGIANLQTQPGSLFGDTIDLITSAVDVALQGAQSYVYGTIFNTAQGAALDMLLSGYITRVTASQSTATVYAYGSAGAAFGAGTVVQTSASGPSWTVDVGVAIPAAPASAYAFEFVNFGTGVYFGQTFTVTIAGTPYSYVVGPADTAATVRAGLIASINLLAPNQDARAGGTSPQNGRLCMIVYATGGGPFTAAVTLAPAATLFLFNAITAAVTAAASGPTLAPAGSLRFCSLPANITGVTNIVDAIPGRTAETDAQFRARWQILQRGMGGGNPDAVRAIVLSPAEIGGGGASFCLVEYNSGDVIDTAGNLPHSLRVVVDAAADGQTVADATWKAKAAGDNTNGTEVYSVLDTANPPAPHDIRIDRLVDVFFGVEITVAVGPDWPALGDPLDQLRQDVTDYINGLQPTSNGGAVRVNLLPISTFPDGTPRGVVNFTVRIGFGPSAGGPFSFADYYPTVEPDANLASIGLTGRQKAVCVITDVAAVIV